MLFVCNDTVVNEAYLEYISNTSYFNNCTCVCNSHLGDVESRVFKFVPPILLILGTVGGLLTILVLCRKNQRRNSSSMYLIALAMFDMFVLHTGLMRQWILELVEIDIRNINNVLCKGNIFHVYFGLLVSSWILVAVTLERLAIVWYPHKSKRYCTRFTALVVTAVIILVAFLVNIHIPIEFEVAEIRGNNYCFASRREYVLFFQKSWVYIYFCIFCVIPSTVHLIGNSLIILNLAKVRRNRRRMVGPKISVKTGSGSQLTINSWSATFAVLLLLDIWFFLCTSPVQILMVLTISSKGDTKEWHRIWAITNMLLYTNNTFNFLLYCVSGSKFRNEVKGLFDNLLFKFKRTKTAPIDIYTLTGEEIETRNVTPKCETSN